MAFISKFGINSLTFIWILGKVKSNGWKMSVMIWKNNWISWKAKRITSWLRRAPKLTSFKQRRRNCNSNCRIRIRSFYSKSKIMIAFRKVQRKNCMIKSWRSNSRNWIQRSFLRKWLTWTRGPGRYCTLRRNWKESSKRRPQRWTTSKGNVSCSEKTCVRKCFRRSKRRRRACLQCRMSTSPQRQD